MAEQPLDLQVQLTPTIPPPPPMYSSLCLINKIGQSIFLDFGYVDPVAIANRQAGIPITANHVARIVMADDAAVKLRDALNQILGSG